METLVDLLNFVENRMFNKVISRCLQDGAKQSWHILVEDQEYVNLLRRQCELVLPKKTNA